MTQERKKSPLVIIGFDAGDPDLLSRWAANETLPTVGSILRRGCWGRTAGPEMISEHGMWVSITSGVSRGKHGYYYHRQLVPGTYDIAALQGRNLGVEPFWRRLGEDIRIAIIDVPDIAAPRPHAGIQLSEWGTHYPYFPVSAYPSGLLDEVRCIAGRQRIIHEKPEGSIEDDREIFAQLMDRVRVKGELCRKLLSGDSYDLVLIVFGECHTGGHQFWKYRSEAIDENSEREAGELVDGIRKIYQAIDAEMGTILKTLPGESNVFILSSVGLKEQWPAMGLSDAFCRRLGYQAVPNASGGTTPMGVLRKALPQGLRDRLSGFLSRETQERLLSDKFKGATDWNRTSVFSIPSYYTSQFRVNLRGREPNGIVVPGEEYDQILSRFESDLASLVDPITMKPAIKAIRRTRDLFGGEPPWTLPDLFAEWEDSDRFVACVRHPSGEIRQGKCEFHRGTDHTQFGFFAGAGPNIQRRGHIGEVSPLDLAPTFLSYFDERLGADLKGKPIRGMAPTVTEGAA